MTETTTCVEHTDDPRIALILEGTCQMEAMLKVLLEVAQADSANLRFFVEGVVPRMLQLNGGTMSATSSECGISELRQVLGIDQFGKGAQHA